MTMHGLHAMHARPVRPGRAHIRLTVGQNPSYGYIRGFLIDGETDGPYGGVSPGTVAGLVVNRVQTNNSNKLVIVSFGTPTGTDDQIPQVDRLQLSVAGHVSVLTWHAGTSRYTSTSAALSNALYAAIDETVDVDLVGLQ